MERVAFLHQETGARIGCLLNPESLVLRRRAGVTARLSAGGLVTGTELSDDPIMYTGGGTTELDLDLLFDVSLAGSSIHSDDVRDLTRPLWDLAENQRRQNAYGKPPCVRFVWGKSWNIPGVVVAVAERLEYFTSAGAPRRSWLRLRLRRISEQEIRPAAGGAGPLHQAREPVPAALEGPGITPEVHELSGAGAAAAGVEAPATPLADERLDQLAFRYYGNAALWRLIASFNGIIDPLRMAAGQLIELPPLTELDEAP